VAVRDGVGGTRFHTIAAKDTAVVVDVVDFREAVAAADPLSGGIFRCFDVDAIRRAGSGTEKTGDAFFQAVFVALQNMRAPNCAGPSG